MAYLRLPTDAPIYKEPGVRDNTPGPKSPHIELLFGDGFATVLEPVPDEGNFVTVAVVPMSPSSRGSILLQSSDPFVAPLIDPNFLTEKLDVYTFVEGMIDGPRLQL